MASGFWIELASSPYCYCVSSYQNENSPICFSADLA